MFLHVRALLIAEVRLTLFPFSECLDCIERLRLCILLKKCESHGTIHGPTNVI